MTIADWPSGERPREKMLARGASALSDAELLAIFLRTGVPGVSALALAQRLLARFGSLGALCRASEAELCMEPGVGRAKYAQLMAAHELTRRALAEQLARADVLESPGAVRDYLRLLLGAREREVFVALFLNAAHEVLAVEELFAGTLTETRVYPRELVRRALLHNAAALIVAHNHPSGRAEASMADIALTATLREALALVDIALLDHFVVTAQAAVSLAESGRLR
ncbi:RadC family protein [Crenobacter intestini]|uniref:JAB domain-containing protein n=1 Tax=Crenobacter intestini TaxID=2563443 RepID=A0A4T0USV8_9NEIS|nr:DNA repair protein RadC [Crenobacter intestini]TIC82039.1 JAB domain-containing protein [Crenobacter intestini]